MTKDKGMSETESLHQCVGCPLDLYHLGGHRDPSLASQSLLSDFWFKHLPFKKENRLLEGTPTFWEDHTFTGGRPQ